jgi:hypothetical protein
MLLSHFIVPKKSKKKKTLDTSSKKYNLVISLYFKNIKKPNCFKII